MAQQQDLHPIDEKFRQTFENLPSSPAASGWDTPSEQVWQNVQQNIATTSNFNIKQWLLVALLAAGIATGVYSSFFKQEKSQPATPAVEQPTQPATAQPIENQPIETIVETPASTPKAAQESKTKTKTKNKPAVETHTTKTPVNSTEKNQAVQPQQHEFKKAPNQTPSTAPTLPKTTEPRQKVVPPNHHELEKQQGNGGN